MASTEQPITERSNPLSTNIDILSPEDIISTLEACDKEIFDGWNDFPGLFDERIQATLKKIVDIAVGILKDPSRSAIIFSGCGTSGRLGFITVRTFNAVLNKHGIKDCCINIMAGDDKALFTSQEAVEDGPMQGVKLLQEAAEGKTRVLFFGITCGMSAPFVAGQLDYCLQHLECFTPVLIGFNPAHQSRNLPIEKWNKTFLQVVKDLEVAESQGQGFLLNPVVGPEPITGSSRMKSGTATKLLLESIMVSSLAFVCQGIKLSISDYLQSYKQVWEIVYQKQSDIASLLQLAGTCLREGGHLYYVGADSLGIMGLIDASECPPTYGATLDDVRGFLEGGYSTLGNAEGDLSHLGVNFQISTEDFMDKVVPLLSDRDLVVFIYREQASIVNKQICESACHKGCIIVSTEKLQSLKEDPAVFSVAVKIDLSPLKQTAVISDSKLWDLVSLLYQELAVKWTLNAVSTGSHIIKGKVFNNNMIDLKASNVKLFHRAVGIIQHISGFPVETCRDYLLRSLYGVDDLTDTIRTAPIADHIKIGSSKEKVVPVALLAVLLQCSIVEAQKVLQQQPIIRQAILSALSQKSQS